MKVKLEKAFEFRAPTAAEIEDARACEDRELGYFARLPRFVDKSDVHHLYWCNSGLIPILRELFALLPDGRSLRGDRLPRFTSKREFTNDPVCRTAWFRQLFFADIPRPFDLARLRVSRRGNWLVCRYRE